MAAFGSLGAQRRMLIGDGVEGSKLGFIVDDSSNETTVSGHAGGAGGPEPYDEGEDGEGPGRGGYALHGGGGSGGGYSTEGGAGVGSGSSGYIAAVGGIIPTEWSYAAILMNSYTILNLGVGGGGGGGGGPSNRNSDIGNGGDGGAGGNALLRFSISDLIESSNRSFPGSDGVEGTQGNSISWGGGGGGGSGGLYLALTTRSYTLNSGTSISCSGGEGARRNSSSSGYSDSGGNGGNGRVILMFGDSATVSGTTNNTEVSRVQILRHLPLGILQSY